MNIAPIGQLPKNRLWDNSTEEAIKECVKQGQLEKIPELLKHFDPSKLMFSEHTSLFRHYLEEGNTEVVKIFLEEGQDPNDKRSKRIESPLHHALCSSHYEIGQLLLKHTIDWDSVDIDPQAYITANKETIICYAVRNGMYELVKRCCKGWWRMEAVGACNQDGVSMLQLSCDNGDDNMAKLLLEYGADCKLVLKDCDERRLHSLMKEAVRYGAKEVVQSLSKLGVDLSKLTEEGISYLEYAVEYRQEEIVCLLLAMEVPIDLSRLMPKAALIQDEILDMALEIGNTELLIEILSVPFSIQKIKECIDELQHEAERTSYIYANLIEILSVPFSIQKNKECIEKLKHEDERTSNIFAILMFHLLARGIDITFEIEDDTETGEHYFLEMKGFQGNEPIIEAIDFAGDEKRLTEMLQSLNLAPNDETLEMSNNNI